MKDIVLKIQVANKQCCINFGLLADSIGKQLRNQKLKYDLHEISLLQDDKKACDRLFYKDLLSEDEAKCIYDIIFDRILHQLNLKNN